METHYQRTGVEGGREESRKWGQMASPPAFHEGERAVCSVKNLKVELER